MFVFFFFSSRRRHTRYWRDWSSDVCSSDLPSLGRACMSTEYAKALGARLRAIRTQQGLSLHGVEQKSQGRWKAVVVGSYERGDRAVTVQRLAELAHFYGVPVHELLPGGTPNAAAELPPKLILNLEALQELGEDKAAPLLR